MTAVCRALLADTNADEQLQNDIVYMAKLYTKAQDNLHDAATNFAKVTIELDSLLERVKALKPKT
jgi:hypothetical protein